MPPSSFTSGVSYLTIAPFAAVASTTIFCDGVNIGGVISPIDTTVLVPATSSIRSNSTSNIFEPSIFSVSDFLSNPEFSGGVTMNESSNPCGTTSILYCPCWFV